VNFLAIDSACSVLSIAAMRKDELFYSETEAGVKHSEIIFDLVDSTLKKASLLPCDLDCVLCMGGPGSFTGLRIGFSIVKGLSLSLSIPFMPVPTFDCIAFPFSKNGITLTVIESGKSSWFYALYHGSEKLQQAEEAGIGQITEKIKNLKMKNITLTGPGADLLYEKLPVEIKELLLLDGGKKGYAKELISIAKNVNLLDNINSSAHPFSGPEYYKKTDAELNLL
jgi:tRNA threonylcarbamoyladenosine biosynthesis protein TsaB